jgi:hypothetical protein
MSERTIEAAAKAALITCQLFKSVAHVAAPHRPAMRTIATDEIMQTYEVTLEVCTKTAWLSSLPNFELAADAMSGSDIMQPRVASAAWPKVERKPGPQAKQ